MPSEEREERTLLDEVARGEVVEKELDLMIERRSRGADPDEREELWVESVRKYRARHREARLWERLHYHQAMLEAHTKNFEEMLRRHRVGIRLVEEALGIASEGDAA